MKFQYAMSEIAAEAWRPQLGPQTAFVECPLFEVVYGGARGGGKTDAALGDFSRHAAHFGSGARGLFVRRTRVALEPTIERGKQIYVGARWHEQKSRFTWPSGAVLYFRYLDRDADAEAYQGHSYGIGRRSDLELGVGRLEVTKARVCGAAAQGQRPAVENEIEALTAQARRQ